MFTKKFTVIISFFLIIAIGIGGMLGYYDARLEAAVTSTEWSNVSSTTTTNPGV